MNPAVIVVVPELPQLPFELSGTQKCLNRRPVELEGRSSLRLDSRALDQRLFRQGDPLWCTGASIGKILAPFRDVHL